jgi:hypothetical protein
MGSRMGGPGETAARDRASHEVASRPSRLALDGSSGRVPRGRPTAAGHSVSADRTWLFEPKLNREVPMKAARPVFLIVRLKPAGTDGR